MIQNKSLPRVLLAIVTAAFTLQIASAQSVWNAVPGTSTDTNWSTSVNWTPNGAPGSAANVLFNNTASAANATTINNVVDSSFGGTVASLSYTNNVNGTFENTVIADGTTLTVSGALTVGGTTDPGAGVVTTTTFAGAAKLNVNNTGANIYVAWGDTTSATGPATLVMSNLDTFTANVSRVLIGQPGVNRASGSITLAKTNTITAGNTGTGTGAAVIIGDNGSNNGNSSTLNLGITNAIYADNIGAGLRKQNGTSGIRFNPSITNSFSPVAFFRGKDGVSAIANWDLGDGTGATATVTSTGFSDFSGGSVNAVVNNLLLARCAAGATGGRTANGTLTMTAGIFTVNVVTNALLMTANSEVTTGTINVRGGTFEVKSNLMMSLMNGFTPGTANGTLNINNATVLANLITAGGGNSVINMTNGTLIVTNTIGAGTALNVFSISNSTLQIPIPNSGAAATVTTLNLGGTTNKINVPAINATILAYPTTLQVIKYSLANGTNAGSFNIGTGTLPAGGFTGFISNDVANSAVVLVVTGGPAPPRTLIWSGLNPDAGNAVTSVWDINSTRDWLSNAVAVSYNDNGGLGGDTVTFNDSGATGTVTLSATVAPSGIIVSNNTLNYTINDNNNGFALAGDDVLIKRGSAKLTLDNAGGVTLSGGITISAGIVQVGNNDGNGGVGSGGIADNGLLAFNRNNSLTAANIISGSGSVAQNGSGTLTLSGVNTFDGLATVATGSLLQLGNNAALGSTNGITIVSNGAAMDFNGKNIGQEPVIASGTGPDSAKGVLYNSGASASPAIARLTLLGDTTIGGPSSGGTAGRWDLRSATVTDANGASLTVPTPGTKLTKVGVNMVAFTGVTVDNNLGDIDVQGGTLSIESATTGVGDPTKTLSVQNGAQLSVFSATNLLNKKLVFYSGSTLDSSSGNNVVVGPLTLTNGNVTVIYRSSTGGTVGGSLTLSNAITGTGSLTKNDTNTLTLAGTDIHSGGTSINDGTFILNTINPNVANALVENVSQTSSPFPVTLGGNGTNAGPVTVDSILYPGISGHPSTFGIGGAGVSSPALFMDGADFSPIAIFSLGSSTTVGSGVNDLVNVMGDMDPSFSTIQINPIAPLSIGGTYTLFTFSGTRLGTFNGNPSTISPSRYTFSLSYLPQSITTTVGGSGPALLKWNNAAGNNLWNVASAANWLNTGTSGNDTFLNFDTVLLDDTIGSGNFTISNTVAVSPSGVTNNSSTANYTIAGNGRITGTAGLTKLGSSTLTINTTNDFSGNVLIAGGAVVVQNANAVGSSSLGAISGGTVTITNGGTLDIGGSTVANSMFFVNSANQVKSFLIAGAGVGGNGAIVNNGSVAQQNVFQAITLTANATVGGTARWDARGNASVNPFINLNGFTLTKTNGNQMSLVNVIITNSGAIVINGGTFSVETASLVSNNTITVNSGGAFGHFRSTAGSISSPITVNGGTITNLAGGGATNDAPITLAANSFISPSSGNDLYLNGVISGSFGFTKLSAGKLILSTNETYSGDTTISAGTVVLVGNGNLSSSANITVNTNTTLDVIGRVNSKLTLNSGQTLAGGGTINGAVSNAVGSTLSPGISGLGILTITNGNLNLNGTTAMDLNKSTATNDAVVVSGNITYGGTLSVNNLAGTLAAGDSFKLFKAGTFAGSFSSISPATPGPGLAWNSTVGVDGKLSVITAASGPPRINAIVVSGTTLSLSVTNGSASGGWTLLQSTNLALPFAQWDTNRTGTFDSNGNLSTNIVNVATNGGTFYILKQ